MQATASDRLGRGLSSLFEHPDQDGAHEESGDSANERLGVQCEGEPDPRQRDVRQRIGCQ